jgi:EpsI family protein
MTDSASALPAPRQPPARLWILVAIVGGGLSASFLLPDRPKMRDCAIAMSLPPQVDAWRGIERKPSTQELDLLARDTSFHKMDYFLVDPVLQQSLINQWHRVSVSIVQSGQDLNSSIHRPERCLPAQGFKDLQSNVVTLDLDGRTLDVVRLRCYSEPPDPVSGKPLAGPDGARLRIQHVIYYWFVGSHSTTPNHYERTFIDMKDRLLGGYDQHWSYVMLSAAFTDQSVAAGVPLGDAFYANGRSEEETDFLLKRISAAVSKHSMRWDQVTD